MLVALPKSASAFLQEALRLGLDIPHKEVSMGYFPVDVLDYRKLQACSTGQSMAKAHLDGNPLNLHLLGMFCPRMVLHLRDPRQALLSLAHHLKRDYDRGDPHYRNWVAPIPPPELLQRSLSAAIDWYLIHQLPNLLEWSERWLAHAESGAQPRVLITQYHELRENVDAVIARILDFYEIPPTAYIPAPVPKDGFTHFRKGELEEWREVFNPAQQEICAELMAGYPRVNRLFGGIQYPAEGKNECSTGGLRQGRETHASTPLR